MKFFSEVTISDVDKKNEPFYDNKTNLWEILRQSCFFLVFIKEKVKEEEENIV